MSGKSLGSLSYMPLLKLAMLLDQPNPVYHSWRVLLTHAEEVAGVSYTQTEVAQFGLIANRASGSPTEAVFQDFIARGLTVDHLYLMLKKMEHVQGMKLLRSHVSPSLRIEMEQDETGKSNSDQNGAGPSGHTNQPHDPPHDQGHNHCQNPTHPKYGPLPVNVPVLVHRPVPVPNGHRSDAPYHQQQPSYPSVSDYTGLLGHTTSSGSYIYSNAGDIPTSAHFQNTQYISQSATNYPSPPPPPYSHLVHLPPSFRQMAYASNAVSPSTQYNPSGHPATNAQVDHHRPGPPPATGHDRPEVTMMGSQPAMNSPDGISPTGGTGYSVAVSPSSPHPLLSPPFGADSQQMGAPESHRHEPVVSSSSSSSSNESQTQSGSNAGSSLNSSLTSNHSSCSADDLLLSMLTFTYSELSTATRNFTEGFVGHGAFGSVFKAYVRGNGPYAIKKLHNESELEGAGFYEPVHQESFMKELQSLSKYKHRNILSLVAVSNDGPRPCLVYEYMENGSLADCLMGQRPVQLTWKHRLEIASQVADALNFLHTVNHPKSLLIHGDVKSSNILLDHYLTPKLSDFGLAKECTSRPGQMTNFSSCSAVVMGTVAYMAPEFLRNHKPSTKTDVYAFGVVLLELYTGQAAADSSLPERTLVLHLQELLTDSESSKPLIIAHADRRAGWPVEIGVGFFDIASVCVRRKSSDRPPMDQVRGQMSELLRDALQYQFEEMHMAPRGQISTYM